ncbi:NAD(P)H-binding protein [Streptomyces melanosporofaciens]|uniref:NAD(P)H-binding protein n=1 Tax=unclassified Streptomyces TaxID=2593676 RepID=UPI0036B1B9E1
MAVTGVTGALGSRIAARLAERGVPQLLVGRDPGRIPELPGAQRRGPAEYADAGAMRAALTGASTLVLISGHPTGRRLEEHAGAVEAGMAVGVERVLYVSLLGAAPTATYRNAPRRHRRCDHGRRPRRGAPLGARRGDPGGHRARGAHP